MPCDGSLGNVFSSLLLFERLNPEAPALAGIFEVLSVFATPFRAEVDFRSLAAPLRETMSLKDVVDWLGLRVFLRAFLKGPVLSCFSPWVGFTLAANFDKPDFPVFPLGESEPLSEDEELTGFLGLF